MKVNRNDPCPCGSGKKYKRCCMARDKAAQAERVAWERAAQNMRQALVGFAKEDVFVKDLAVGLGVFWQDRYTVDTVHMMSVDESLRFFDWFAHDYALQAVDDPAYVRKHLIKVYYEQVDDALDEREAVILQGWIASLPGSAFVIERAEPTQGTVELRDLFLADRALVVHDASAAKHGEVGQLLLARPLPERERVRLAGATVVLPASEKEGLRAFIEQERTAYLVEHPAATMDQYLRDRAYLFTHYALEWADREDRPAVTADDPEARKPGAKAMQRVVKWQQDRVQIH